MSTPLTIETTISALVVEFAPFRGDRAMTLSYLMELGGRMTGLTAEERERSHSVSGCLAKVWLLFRHDKGRIFIRGDSDAMITKGLVGLLIRVLSGQKTDDVVSMPPLFPKELGLGTWLTQQRKGGFLQMWADVQQEAQRHMTF